MTFVLFVVGKIYEPVGVGNPPTLETTRRRPTGYAEAGRRDRSAFAKSYGGTGRDPAPPSALKIFSKSNLAGPVAYPPYDRQSRILL